MSNIGSNDLLDDIKRAKEGKTVTIPFKHKKLSKFIFLGRNLYHLIGGAGGSGKSAWVDLNYVINPALWAKYYGEEENIDVKVILRSMERSKKHRIAKWVCMQLYLDHGILIDVPSLLGWGVKKSKITDELYEKVKEAYDFVRSLEDHVEVIDGIENPTGIYKQMKSEALSSGKLYRYEKYQGKHELFEITKKDKKKVDPRACPGATRYQPVYKPDNPRKITIEVIDHLQALKSESGYNNKQNLDKMSEYARIGRDLFGFTQVIVNQMNRNISDTYRRVKTDLMPEDKDFSGSSMMFNDCDMAGVLFNPYKYNLDSLKDYRVKDFVNDHGINRFRTFHLLKNTYGPDNQIFAYNFIGENGMFKELPKPAEMNEGIYRKARDPKREQLITKYL